MDDTPPDPIVGLNDNISQLSKRLGEAIAASRTAKDEAPEFVSGKKSELERFNENYAVVLRGSQAVIMRESYDPALNSRQITFLLKDAFLLMNQNRQYKSKFSTRPVFLAKAWLEWEKRRQYDGIVFKPGLPEEIECTVDFGDCGKQYNLWRGFSFTPTDGGIYDIFLDHIRVNLCAENEAHYKWVLAWMADLFQHPERKNGTALVMRGEMGTGKGTIAQVLGRLISKHFIQITQPSQIVGRFNAHLADKILVFLDEALWAGDKSTEGVLRGLITEEKLAVEQKGKDTVPLENYSRFILATNHDWAVPTGMGDERRFPVFNIGNGVKGNREYFSAMHKQLNEGGYASLLKFFLEYKYDENDLRVIPKTDALLDQKILSMPHWMSWWREKLMDGLILPEDYRWPEEIGTLSFYKDYLNSCEDMRIARPLDKHWLLRRIKEKCCASITSKQSTGGKRVIVLESLNNCRVEFQEALGHKIEWGDTGREELF